jgi:hypothetical protein
MTLRPHGGDALHVRTIRIFVIVVKVSCGCDPLRAPLPPLLATLDVLLGALDGDVGWCRLAVAGDSLPTA